MFPRRKLERHISLDMQAADSKRLLTFLECRECGELAYDAVETACCRALLCAGCLQRRDTKCPECQAACAQEPSHLARRLIGTQPWRCPSCGWEATRSDQPDHGLVCPRTERRCPADGCAFRGLPDALLLHLTDAHKAQLLGRCDYLFDLPGQLRRRALEPGLEALGSPSASSIGSSVGDSLLPLRIRSGTPDHETDLGLTGKHYCQRPLNGPLCDCCDGVCGPSTGCNCVDCMRLDLLDFNVGTPHTLVNREGAVARISGQSGQFHCGRPTTEGLCGPDGGHNCHACRKLDEQVFGRYADIAAEWGDLVESRDNFDFRRFSIIGSDVAFDTID